MRSGLLSLLLLGALTGTGFCQGITRTIAVTGDIAPGAGGGTYRVFDQLSLNNNGELAFIGAFDGGSAQSAIYKYSGGITTPLVVNNDPTPAGGRHFYFNLPRLRDSGELIYDAAVLDASISQGIFRTQSGSASLALAGYSAAPAGGTFATVNLSAVNNSGQFAFDSVVSDKNGLYRHDGATITRLVQVGDSTPVGGVFKTVGSATGLSDSGEVIFSASYNDGTTKGGLFRTDGVSSSAVAVKGGATPVGGTWLGMGFSAINASGQVAISASIAGGTTDLGIFLQKGATLSPFVLQGDSVPGLPGVSFAKPLAFVLNDQGQLAFTATLQGSGVDASNDTALFVGSSLSNLTLIAREGASLNISGSERTLVGDVTLSNFALNNDALAWVANFDGGSALMLSSTTSAPEPTTLCLLALGMVGVLVWSRKRHSPA